jgi:hypothetical protein
MTIFVAAMKNNDDIFREFQESLENMKGHFHVLESSVPVERQMEYFHYSEDVKKQSEGRSIEGEISELHSLESSINDKKFAMTYLAVSGDVKAFRELEAYSKTAEPELNDWIQMSLLQAKIILESEFSDEKQVFISTGLGGHERKLRFFSFFKSNELKPFSPYQIQLIKKEIPFHIKKYGGQVEELEVFDNYFTVLYLIDLSVNIKNMMEEALNECNQYGDFISRSFIITNVKKYTEEEIRNELERKNE